jgi:hypothetical protein
MSTRSDAMRDVLAALAPDLKSAGFRKRGRCFNRSTEPGVVHVIDFQMQPYRVPPGSPTPPGLVDGSFRIELGVYADALADWENREGKWVNEYNCQIRAGVGDLLYGHDHDRRAVDPLSGVTDIWWSLADLDLAVDAAASALRNYALPWLNGLVTEQSVVERNRALTTRPPGAATWFEDLHALDADARARTIEQMTLGHQLALLGEDAAPET